MGRPNRRFARQSPAGAVGDRAPVLDYEPASDARAPMWTRGLLALALAGVLATLGISLSSWGTTDTLSFVRFAYGIDRDGLLATYRNDALLNHPPIPAYWCLAALWLSGKNAFAFAVIFRLPMIVAAGAGAFLVGRIARGRGASPQAAAALTAAAAWNPCVMLVSGYHCNTDPVYAALCLLAVYLLQDRGRPLLGGLALGLAINVKLIPVLLIVPLALAARSRRELARFVAGLAVMALPFVPPLLMEPAFARNVLAYRSQIENWGIPFLLDLLTPGNDIPGRGEPAEGAPATIYFRTGSAFLLGATLLWAVAARVAGRWDRYQVAAVTFALFLVLAPGFGVQYLVIVAPLLYAAARPALAHAYGLLAGAFLLAVYWLYWDGGFPLVSLVDLRFPRPLALLGLATWGLLVYFVATVILTPRDARTGASAATPPAAGAL